MFIHGLPYVSQSTHVYPVAVSRAASVRPTGIFLSLLAIALRSTQLPLTLLPMVVVRILFG